MLLNDIGRAPTASLRKINQYLESSYGFILTADSGTRDIIAVMESINDEITQLKVKGGDAKASPEISKRLLILEGLRALKENAIELQLESPDLEPLVTGLIDAVVNHFRKCGQHSGHLDDAITRAMEEYRGSEYLFPDDYIEHRVRDGALGRLSGSNKLDIPEPDDELDVEMSPSIIGGTDDVVDEDFAFKPLSKEEYLSKRKELQKMQLDPATARYPATRKLVMLKLADLRKQAQEAGLEQVYETEEPESVSNKGIEMKENVNFIKHLRTLLETEVSQAEVMMAAKGFAQELQEMVEKIGRLQNEDLPPVTDQMRETYGTDSASAFQTQIYGALQGVMDSLYTAKNQVDEAVSNMASRGQVDAQVDMDKGIDKGIDDVQSDEPTGDLDLDNIGNEPEDDFGAAETDEPLGREMKESIKLKKKIAEMKNIVAKARRLKESSK